MEEYQIDCSICEVDSTVIVEDIDEKPIFCPMCGSDLPED